jgi:hypothetical protein
MVRCIQFNYYTMKINIPSNIPTVKAKHTIPGHIYQKPNETTTFYLRTRDTGQAPYPFVYLSKNDPPHFCSLMEDVLLIDLGEAMISVA